MLIKAQMFKKVKKIPEFVPLFLNLWIFESWILNRYLDLYEQPDSLVDVANN